MSFVMARAMWRSGGSDATAWRSGERLKMGIWRAGETYAIPPQISKTHLRHFSPARCALANDDTDPQ